MSNSDKIREYFRRQYDTEEGTVEENLAELFADDLVYHIGDKHVGRGALAETARAIRSAPKADRTVEVSDFREEGESVIFHLTLNVPGVGPDGGALVLESDNNWRFNTDGKVVEASPVQVAEVEDAFRAAGVELEE